MRVESAKPVAAGGWIHKTDMAPMQIPLERKRKTIDEIEAMANKMFQHQLASLIRHNLAKKLGVSAGSLASLFVGIGYDYDGSEFASFPCRNELAKIIGITRRYPDGTKKTMSGTSNSGVFAPIHWYAHEGPVFIVEGASDTACLDSNGFSALGRPSNIGGVMIIEKYLARRAKGRPTIVIGENDRKLDRCGTDKCAGPYYHGDCLGCAWCWPGMYGARMVGNRLLCELVMPPEEFKDVRQWANAVGHESFRLQLQAATATQPAPANGQQRPVQPTRK